MMQAIICMRNAYIFRLRSINQMPKNPAAVFTMRIHLFFAIFAGAIGSNTGNNYMLTFFKTPDSGAYFFNYSNSFTPERGSGFAGRRVAVQNSKVCSTDRCFNYFYQGISWFFNDWFRNVFQRDFSGAAIHE